MTTVLGVEDMVAEQDMMSHYVEESGYTVIRANDGREALAKVMNQKPDLIITDLVMPEMNGLELCRSLRKNPDTKHLPIIACTCKNQELDRLWGIKQGVNLYITKPYTREELIQGIKSLLS